MDTQGRHGHRIFKINQTTTHNESEGHEHQYSDFSIGIRDSEKVKLALESKLQEVSLSEPYADHLKNIVRQFTPSFLSKGMKIDVKCKHTCPIKTEGDPFKQNCQRMSPKQREIIVAEIENILKVGVIRPSNSPWASRLLVVKKADGT